MELSLSPLPYAKNALEPAMSAETLEFHHDKHHAAYITEANKLLPESGLADLPLEEIVRKSHGVNPKLFNNIAQHYNHLHFWQWMTPNGGGKPSDALAKKFTADFGSVENMQTAFMDAGLKQFGSGWTWVALKDGKLTVMGTPNGENPLVHGAAPILGCDVWEHSYYIDYRNKRADYLKAFFEKLINWKHVEDMLQKA